MKAVSFLKQTDIPASEDGDNLRSPFVIQSIKTKHIEG